MGGFRTAVWTLIRNRKLECTTSLHTTIPRLRIAAQSDDAGRARMVNDFARCDVPDVRVPDEFDGWSSGLCSGT